MEYNPELREIICKIGDLCVDLRYSLNPSKWDFPKGVFRGIPKTTTKIKKLLKKFNKLWKKEVKTLGYDEF